MRRSDESLHSTWYLRLRLLESESRRPRFVLDGKKVVWGSGSQSGDGRKILSNNKRSIVALRHICRYRLGIRKSYGRITNDLVPFMICYISIIGALW